MILNVDKSGVVSETKILSDKVSELYKKLGYKTADKMEDACAIWSEGVNHIHVYGKTKGRAGSENKYEFPPPIDGTLFFGNVLIVLVSGDSGNEKIVDLTLKAWEVVYERLFGGFEDLVDSDGNALSDEEDSEDSELEGVEYTKEGYVKDDFIVDDSDDLEDEDYELHLPKKKRISAAKKVSIAVVAKKAVDSGSVEEKKSKKKACKKKDEKVVVEVAEKLDAVDAVKKETKKKVSKKKGAEVAEVKEVAAVKEVAEKVSKKESKKVSKKKGEEVEEIVEKKN